jgi:hypothetical protein
MPITRHPRRASQPVFVYGTLRPAGNLACNWQEFGAAAVHDGQVVAPGHRIIRAPGAVYPMMLPARASWERFDLEVRANDIAEKPGDSLYFNLAKGFLGAEVASSLVQYGKTHKFQVSGEDVWYRYADKKSGVAERMKHLGQEQWLSVIQRACDYCKKWKTLPPECGPNLKAFYNDMPIELRPESWGKLVMAGSSETDKKDNAEWAKSIHPYLVVELVTGTFGVPVGAKGVNVKPMIPKVLQDRLDANKGK